jgi:hypothetical protein
VLPRARQSELAWPKARMVGFLFSQPTDWFAAYHHGVRTGQERSELRWTIVPLRRGCQDEACAVLLSGPDDRFGVCWLPVPARVVSVAGR